MRGTTVGMGLAYMVLAWGLGTHPVQAQTAGQASEQTPPSPAATSAAAVQAAAAAPVVTLQTALLEAMRNADAWGYAGRYAHLAPVITATHDLPRLARSVLGRRWRALQPAQRDVFSALFADLVRSTYARRFDGYDGEAFGIDGGQMVRPGQYLVRAYLLRADGDRIRFDYMLRHGNRGWRIANVVVDGVSDLALKRAEYAAILDRDGFDALRDILRERVADADTRSTPSTP